MKSCVSMASIVLLLLSESVWSTIPGAYRHFAFKHQVPADILFSVCLQESGRKWEDKFLPWPWTLNIAGKGVYYNSPAEAQSHLFNIINVKGSCRVDIGLCQVHWCAHGKNFSAPAQLLNPYTNLDYAARLIRLQYDHTLRNGTPDWWIAVGRYHSPNNPKLAQIYRERVKARWQRYYVKNEPLVFAQQEKSQ